MLRLGFGHKQVPDRWRVSNKLTLTLTLSRPTGEGTARPVSRSFHRGWICRPTTEGDSPSPIRWERAGVRVDMPQNPKLFLHQSLTTSLWDKERFAGFLRSHSRTAEQ